MMFPEGWVTDLELSRTALLRLLGNAVVPPCAALAWECLYVGGERGGGRGRRSEHSTANYFSGQAGLRA